MSKLDLERQAKAASVVGSLIAANAVVGSHISAGVVVNSHLGANAVDGAKIAANAIVNSHLGDSAVDSPEIAAGAIDTSHLAAGVGGMDVAVATPSGTINATNKTFTLGEAPVGFNVLVFLRGQALERKANATDATAIDEFFMTSGQNLVTLGAAPVSGDYLSYLAAS